MELGVSPRVQNCWWDKVKSAGSLKSVKGVEKWKGMVESIQSAIMDYSIVSASNSHITHVKRYQNLSIVIATALNMEVIGTE